MQCLKEIVSELIDIDTGIPKPGTNKEQLLYAIQEIRKVQSIYDKRIEDRVKLNEEFRATSKRIKSVGCNMSRINNKYGGKVFPKWFLEMFGA